MQSQVKLDNSLKKSVQFPVHTCTSTVSSLSILNQSLTDSLSSRSNLDYHDVPSDFGKMKKSYFQITKITNRKEDALEDFDEATNTEDLSFDVSRTDMELEPSSTSTVHSPAIVDEIIWPNMISNNLNNMVVSNSVQSSNNNNNLVGSQKGPASTLKSNKKTPVSCSRFKVVKLESQDWLKRGRWTCLTFSDPPVDVFKPPSLTQLHDNSHDSIYYIPSFHDKQTGPMMFAPIVYNEGHPSLKSNQNSVPSYYFLSDETPSRSTTIFNASQLLTENDSNDQLLITTSSHIPTSVDSTLQPSTVSQIKPNFLLTSPSTTSKVFNKRSNLNQNPLFAMVTATMSSSSFSDNDEGGPASVAIDNKIEQALDLVKSHLMFAVREEVEVLKEQIKELIEKNSLLEAENKFLRNEAAPETLAKLLQQQPVVPQPSTILPPSQPQQLLQQKLILQQKLQGNNKQFVKQQQPQKQLD